MATPKFAITQTDDSKGAEFGKKLERDIANVATFRSGISFKEGVKKAFSALVEDDTSAETEKSNK